MLEHNSCIAIFACFILLIIGVLTLAAISVINTHKNQKAVQEIMKYQIHVNADINSSIPEILDLVITECFNDYRIKFLEPIEQGYITSEREIEIRSDLVRIVTGRISEATLDKLSLFYNINSIADILADKIYICVMNYVVDHNKDFLNVSE